MAYFKHHKAECGRHHYHSDYNLELAEELSYFDRDSLQDFLTTPYINYAYNFLTDSFFSLSLFEYSVIVAYLINVRGCAEIVYREVNRVLYKIPIDLKGTNVL